MQRIQLPGGYTTVVDDADSDLVAGFRWRALILPTLHYVHAWHGRQHLYMHRLIMAAPKGKHVDHEDGDGFNNQRSNLRLATPSQNHANAGPNIRAAGKSSRFKGVYWDARRSRWAATIHVDGKTSALGRYSDEQAAAAAYDRAAVTAWGEFAKPNLPAG